MGMRPSPCNAVHFYYWGEEFAEGDLHDCDNPLFGYDAAKLNLPGMDSYDNRQLVHQVEFSTGSPLWGCHHVCR